MGRSSGLRRRVACLENEASPDRGVLAPRSEFSLASMTVRRSQAGPAGVQLGAAKRATVCTKDAKGIDDLSRVSTRHGRRRPEARCEAPPGQYKGRGWGATQQQHAVHDDGICTLPSATRVLCLESVQPSGGDVCSANDLHCVCCTVFTASRYATRAQLTLGSHSSNRVMPCEPAPQLLIRPVATSVVLRASDSFSHC